mgnify:CR=1 FL=1
MGNDTISFGGNRILSFYKDAKKLRDGETVIPRMISAWLAEKCNLNCHYCLYTESHNQYGAMADTNKFLKFIDEIVDLGVESIELGGGGEPTVHKDCFKIAKYAHDKGLQVGMLTNAARFDIPLALESFRYIRLGIDAHEDGLYQIVKGTTSGTFAKTERNCANLIAERNNSGRVLPRIGVKHLIGRKNVPYLKELVAWAWELSADYVHFKAEHNSPDALTLEERIQYGIVLDELKIHYPGFIKGDLNFLQGKYHCFISPIHAVMDAKGGLWECCYFANEDRDKIGNVFDEGFKNIWFSDQHKKVMESKTIENCNKFDCRFHLYNNQAVEMLEGTEQDLAFI